MPSTLYVKDGQVVGVVEGSLEGAQSISVPLGLEEAFGLRGDLATGRARIQDGKVMVQESEPRWVELA